MATARYGDASADRFNLGMVATARSAVNDGRNRWGLGVGVFSPQRAQRARRLVAMAGGALGRRPGWRIERALVPRCGEEDGGWVVSAGGGFLVM